MGNNLQGRAATTLGILCFPLQTETGGNLSVSNQLTSNFTKSEPQQEGNYQSDTPKESKDPLQGLLHAAPL